MYQHIKVPAEGKKITVNADYSLDVPDNPVIPYIEGDGTGVDISPVMIKVIDAAVAKAYGGKRRIHWMEVYAGDKLVRRFLKVDKVSTALGTEDGKPRAYRYGYGVLDENLNMIADPGEKKVYFEVSDYSNTVFFESPR